MQAQGSGMCYYMVRDVNKYLLVTAEDAIEAVAVDDAAEQACC